MRGWLSSSDVGEAASFHIEIGSKPPPGRPRSSSRTGRSYAVLALMVLAVGACGSDQPTPLRTGGRSPTADTNADGAESRSEYAMPAGFALAQGDATLSVTGSAGLQNGRHTPFSPDLAFEPSNELSGRFAPRVVVAPDSGFLLYTSWEEVVHDDPALSWAEQDIEAGDVLGVPVVRRLSLTTGEDVVFVRGGSSAVVSPGGAVAWTQGREEGYRAAVPYESSIVVSQSIDDPGETWVAEPGARYTVSGWAGEVLLAIRWPKAENEGFRLLALRGPNQVTELGTDAQLAAVSPDGNVFAVTATNPVGGIAGDEPAVRLLRSDTLETVATLTAEKVSAAGVNRFNPGGAWVADRLALPGEPGATLLDASKSSDGSFSLVVDAIVATHPEAFPFGVDLVDLDPGNPDVVRYTAVTPYAAVMDSNSDAARLVGQEYGSLYVSCRVSARVCSFDPQLHDPAAVGLVAFAPTEE